ncbi:MAG: hypothetical protein N2444_10705, partial [Methylocystis sp.]|nr:hypothetical protein [Methylocystis sp.]
DDPVFRTSLDNPIVRQFCHDLGSEPVADQDFAEACANLKKMDFIFFNESLDDDIRVFFREIDVALDEIGRSNDTEKKHIEDPDNYRAAEPVAMPTNDPAFSQALDKYTLYDRQLYDFALELMRKRIRDGLSLPELPTKRFKVTEGEKVPAASPAMKKILGRGWQWDGEIIWSVADEAHLRFTVRWKSKCENSFARVELIPGMFTGRGRLDVTVSAQGGGQRQIIFIEPGYVLMRKKIGDDADFVCAGNGPFFLDVPLPPSPDSSGGYLLKFAIGPRSSPLTLNYNNDGRPLGIRIESVRILTAAEAAIPLR